MGEPVAGSDQHAVRPPRWVRGTAAAGILGVAAYVASWALAGAVRSDYDPLEQAISELFERGAPAPGRGLLVASLVASGVALIVFAAAMDRGLPGRGRAGPIAAAVSGIMTVLVAAAPCTQGCPGYGSSVTDSAHVVLAGIGYLALVLAPLLTARRLRPVAPRFAAWSVGFGVVALAGFLVRSFGLVDAYGGLQQRVFNTIADAWFVVVAVWLLTRGRGRRGGRPGSARRRRPFVLCVALTLALASACDSASADAADRADAGEHDEA